MSLETYIEKIKALLSAGDAASLTYAALEARLGMEFVCYERLRLAHKYLSPDDLRTWKPNYVVQTVMEMVDPKIASEFTLSMGSEPAVDSPEWVEPKEWVKIGEQKGFDPKLITNCGRQWAHSFTPRCHEIRSRESSTTDQWSECGKG